MLNSFSGFEVADLSWVTSPSKKLSKFDGVILVILVIFFRSQIPVSTRGLELRISCLHYTRSGWLSYFNFKKTFQLRWCYAHKLFWITDSSEHARVWTVYFYHKWSYLTHVTIRPNRSGRFEVPKFATLK